MAYVNVTKRHEKRVIDPATFKIITMVKERVLTVEEYVERNNWCIENCKEKHKWVGGAVEPHFVYTSYKAIWFKTEQDAMGFKLRWC